MITQLKMSNNTVKINNLYIRRWINK